MTPVQIRSLSSINLPQELSNTTTRSRALVIWELATLECTLDDQSTKKRLCLTVQDKFDFSMNTTKTPHSSNKLVVDTGITAIGVALFGLQVIKT
mmetsp:Transcript_9819/g.22675  ORF Transcript_9819/g.22675 Transcript_9819/m.22675 type:complete len:95 (-) Transcript_9819:537-821(-)